MLERKLKIRRARPTETGAVARLLLAAFAELQRDFYWPEGWDDYLRGIANVEARQDQAQLWVAELDTKIVGSPWGNSVRWRSVECQLQNGFPRSG